MNKIKLISIFGLALAVVLMAGVNSASAALTIDATTISSDGAAALTTSLTGGTITIGLATGTGTITLGSSSDAQTTIIGGGAGISTVQIAGGTAANVITIGNAQTAGSITMGNAMTTGNIQIGGASMTDGLTKIYGGTATGAGTAAAISLTPGTAGTIVIGKTNGTGAISIGASTGNQAINIGTGGAGSIVKTIIIGNATAGGASVTTIHAGTAGLNLGTTADARTIAIGTGDAIQTINIGTHITPVNVITIGGTASTLGFYGVTPVVRATAYTQTYATADKTHANPTATNPAAPAAYTAHAAGAVAVVSNAATDLDTTAAALATLRGEVAAYELVISALIVDVADLKQLVNSLIDDQQTLGLVQ